LTTLRKVFAGLLPAAAAALLAACSSPEIDIAGKTVTAYEGARVITGDGGPPIENAVIVVADGRFVRVGRRGELVVPDGAVHVDLAGKTVMPALVDLHGHFGFQNVAEGTMSKQDFTRENLVDHMRRLAYHGVAATVGVGDLVARADLNGGRTDWGAVPLQLRTEIVPGAALFRTSGPGIAWPGSGAQGHPSRVDVSYPVSTEEEARAAVRDYVRMQPEFIKIWVDDRGGRKRTLTPPLYRAIADEAHRFNVPVAVHNVTLADAKELMRAGVDGWLHVPVRGGDTVDDEFLALVKARSARSDRPVQWITPSLITAWMNMQGGGRPAWLDDPLLRATYSSRDIETHWGDPLRKMTPDAVARARRSFEQAGRNAMLLRAAGMRIVSGTDTGQSRFWIGYFSHLDMESMVAFGMTPHEAIVAATRDAAATAHVNTGLIAPGRNADFIVLDANPLDRIANTRRIDRVVLRGAPVPRALYAAQWQAQFRPQLAQAVQVITNRAVVPENLALTVGGQSR
jgi:imidazolonepropionase-like amidohydrolase